MLQKKNNLKTCVTYQHFTSPLWFTAKGGWEKSSNVKHFINYAEKVTTELGDLIDIVCTINEANLTACFAHSFPSYPEEGMKNIMPFIKEAAEECGSTLENFGPFLFGHPFKIRDCMMEAHVKSVPVIKSILKHNQPVGVTLSIMDYQAAEGGEQMRDKANAESVDCCLDQVINDDFVGVQMYTRHTYGPDGIIKPKADDPNMLVMGYEYYPESLENVVRYVSSRIKTPIMITENGIGTDDDNQRIEYLTTALQGLQNCIDDGIDIRGYFCWSLLDNFEWLFGYKPRFGLVEVNRDTLERTAKKSFKFFKDIIDRSS